MNKLIFLLLLCFVETVVSAEDSIYDASRAFETGLAVGVDSFEREYLIQGWKGDSIEPLEFMVVLDSKNCSTKKILLLKDFGFRNGLSPVELSNHTILFKSFDNLPDAKELIEYLNSMDFKDIPEKMYVHQKKSSEKFKKAPFAFKYIFERIQKDIKGGVQVLVITPEKAKSLGIVSEVPSQLEAEITKPVLKQAEKSSSKPGLIKKKKAPDYSFNLKGGRVEYFSYTSKFGGSDHFAGRTFEDKKFKIQKEINNRGQILLSSGSVSSVNGVRYIKVTGKNMYFDAYDVSMRN